MLLTASNVLLDKAAGEIRQLALEPTRENIKKIATALAEIAEIKFRLYALRPDLEACSLFDDAAEFSQAERAFGAIIVHADDLVQAGQWQKALALYEEYLEQDPPEFYRQVVQRETEKLRRPHR